MADLVDILHGIAEDSMNAYGLSDLTVGTVTKTGPLEVTTRETMAPLPQEVLWLTAAVVEKKIPVLEHEHITAGFRHNHTISGLVHNHGVPGLGHSHTTDEGTTGDALNGSYQTDDSLGGSHPTEDGLLPDAYTSDRRLEDVVCYEDGNPLPVENGYIILNRGLAMGDKVLLMRVMRGQQFVILSRIYERSGTNANIAAIQHRLLPGDCVPRPAVLDVDRRSGDAPAEGPGR